MEPPTPNSAWGDFELSQEPGEALLYEARERAAEGDYGAAHLFQRWGYENAKDVDSLYDLACYASRDGDVNGAIHWLQLAAEVAGVDAEWAGDDPDLEPVRDDARWPRLQQYLERYNTYWLASDIAPVSLVLPRGYVRSASIPVLVGLHGKGSGPDSFVDSDYQRFADANQIALLGVSGTRPAGPASFSWSESVSQDRARVDAALEAVSDRVTPAFGQIVLFGFSQGAAMAAEIALSDPDRFAGAIVMSPGTSELSADCVKLSQREVHKRQGYVFVVGAGEAFGNVLMTEDYAEKAKGLGARTYYHAYKGMAEHSFPPDFSEALPLWVEFVLTSDRKSPAHHPAALR